MVLIRARSRRSVTTLAGASSWPIDFWIRSRNSWSPRVTRRERFRGSSSSALRAEASAWVGAPSLASEAGRAARTSVFYATGLIGLFYLLTFVLGIGSMVYVGPDVITGIDKGGNMAAPLLAEVLGGTPLLGFIAAVAFSTNTRSSLEA